MGETETETGGRCGEGASSLPAMDPTHDLEVGEPAMRVARRVPAKDPLQIRGGGGGAARPSSVSPRAAAGRISRSAAGAFPGPCLQGWSVGSREWEDRSIAAHDIGRAGRGSLCGEARRGTVTWPAERGISCSSCSRRAITAGSWSSLSSSSQLRPGVVIVTCDCSEP